MAAAGKFSLLLGLVTAVVGVASRLMVEPVLGVEAHAIFEFSQTCLLFTIAVGVLSCKK